MLSTYFYSILQKSAICSGVFPDISIDIMSSALPSASANIFSYRLSFVIAANNFNNASTCFIMVLSSSLERIYTVSTPATFASRQKGENYPVYVPTFDFNVSIADFTS